jgi:hypothetical protein
MMSNLAILGITVGLSFISFGLIAKWYVLPWIRGVSPENALTPLLLGHSFRFISLSFLVTETPAAFAIPAAYGDMMTALLALIAVGALRSRWPVAGFLVWLFNIFGTLNLLLGFYQGLSIPIDIGLLGPAYFIPTVIAPILLSTHFIIFRLLLRSKSAVVGTISPAKSSYL